VLSQKKYKKRLLNVWLGMINMYSLFTDSRGLFILEALNLISQSSIANPFSNFGWVWDLNSQL